MLGGHIKQHCTSWHNSTLKLPVLIPDASNSSYSKAKSVLKVSLLIMVDYIPKSSY